MRASLRHVWDSCHVPALRGAVSGDALPGVRAVAFAGGMGGGGAGGGAAEVVSGFYVPLSSLRACFLVASLSDLSTTNCSAFCCCSLGTADADASASLTIAEQASSV